MKNAKSNIGKVVTVSAGVAAIAAASYFFLGSKGKKNRKMTKAWMIKMKGDVVEKMESMQDVTQEKYDALVDAAGSAYAKVADSKDEVASLAKEIKSHWKTISKKATKKITKKISSR